MTLLALDTSVAVPLLVRRHQWHSAARSVVAGLNVCLTGHSQAETYSVLTRLPGDARVDPQDAARLLSVGFERPLLLDGAVIERLPAVLAEQQITGGAVYDALVGLATVGVDVTLLTRDRRAAATYTALGVEFAFA